MVSQISLLKEKTVITVITQEHHTTSILIYTNLEKMVPLDI